MFVSPIIMPPACLRLATTAEFPGAMLFRKAETPFEFACPSTSTLILMVMGTP